ncbi:hypothetical protein CMO90_02790 [Candidatus Woesearchaeota archaeon]|jgi:hypothetical protein|nr:hypothetical protein [Candidatus Woesearchaeota archaeon]|tara:strand:+ start:597 stop:1082 length:486 start_codon:yes stop_codon:yes gene_type:complete
MEDFQIASDKAKKNIQIADHMLIMTFPLVKDPKLLLAVMKNIFSSLNNSMSSLLYYERLFKRIPIFQDSFESKFIVFKNKMVSKHHIDNEYVNLIQEIREILLAHKNSPVEFSRGDRFVICSDNYRMKTIKVSDLKKYVAKTKLFIIDINRLVSKNAGIFK